MQNQLLQLCLIAYNIMVWFYESDTCHACLLMWVKLNRLRCGTARVGDTLKLWGAQDSATCACGHITQSVQHVVVDCMIHKAPDGFAGLRRPDAATMSWLKDLNIEI